MELVVIEGNGQYNNKADEFMEVIMKFRNLLQRDYTKIATVTTIANTK